MRRTRQAPWSRSMVAESALSPSDFIWPIFLIEGENRTEPVKSMPGVERMTIDVAVRRVEEAAELGVPCVALFPNIDASLRSADCAEAWNPENLICRATRAIKAAVPQIGIMEDVALDPYNALGHDGIVIGDEIINDESVEALVKQALAQADAGANIIGPSDMMDGRIGAIRDALEAAGYQNVMLLSYAAKYASSFYGPFRDAVGAAGKLTGDKKTYQMDPFNSDEALREVALDLSEGADMVMIKPGMPYLDVCQRVKTEFGVPTFAYQTSGEYAMLEAAAAQGWLDRDKAIIEALTSFKRAGCDGMLSYYAVEVAKRLAVGA
ncbi:UNVERIFIED_CONTAM: hypothetical protein GTU68_061344 [Idotea baltica]|nr:hypothetical protein [Idotea baltica]